MTPEFQAQIALTQLFIDVLGYTGTIIAAFAIAVPLMLGTVIKEPEKSPVAKYILVLLAICIGAIILLLLLSLSMILDSGTLYSLTSTSPGFRPFVVGITVIYISAAAAIGIVIFLMTRPKTD